MLARGEMPRVSYEKRLVDDSNEVEDLESRVQELVMEVERRDAIIIYLQAVIKELREQQTARKNMQ